MSCTFHGLKADSAPHGYIPAQEVCFRQLKNVV